MKKTKDPKIMLFPYYYQGKARLIPAERQISLDAAMDTEVQHNVAQAASLNIMYNDLNIKRQDIVI